MTKTITRALSMVETDCYTCGFPFMVPEWFDRQCRERKREWYCPSCARSTIYSESEVEKLKRELADTEFWRKQYEQERGRHTVTENRRRAAAGQLTKLRKRVGHGVCPCCKRTFKQLAAHMARKHPEFAELDLAGVLNDQDA